MLMAVENSAEKRIAHVYEIPGAAAQSSPDDQVAMTLRFETLRFRRCFSYLPFVDHDVYSVVESYDREKLGDFGTTMPVFQFDREWTAEQYACAERMARESICLYEECYASFPYPLYNTAEEGQPECSAALLKQSYCTALHHLTELILPEMEASEDCAKEIDAILQSAWYQGCRSEEPGKGSGLAAAWLRAVLELTHSAGRTLYKYGISTVGARIIVNSFQFDQICLSFYR